MEGTIPVERAVGLDQVVADVERDQDEVRLEGEALVDEQVEVVGGRGAGDAHVEDLCPHARLSEICLEKGEVVVGVGHDAEGERVAEGDDSKRTAARLGELGIEKAA
jgi:hypothetical protein